MTSVRIPKGLRSIYNCPLYLPAEFRADKAPLGFCEKYEWDTEQYGYIRSMRVNDTKIGKVVFE